MKSKKFFALSVIILLVILVAIATLGYYRKNYPPTVIGLANIFSRIEAQETCSQQNGFASSCWENGLRLVRMTDARLSELSVQVTLSSTMPPSASAAIIAPTAYWWSTAKARWQPIALQGTLYQNSVWLDRAAYANAALPQSELAPGPNYIITWDYIYSTTEGWLGPRCTPKTQSDTLNNCWRLVEFTLH